MNFTDPCTVSYMAMFLERPVTDIAAFQSGSKESYGTLFDKAVYTYGLPGKVMNRSRIPPMKGDENVLIDSLNSFLGHSGRAVFTIEIFKVLLRKLGSGDDHHAMFLTQSWLGNLRWDDSYRREITRNYGPMEISKVDVGDMMCLVSGYWYVLWHELDLHGLSRMDAITLINSIMRKKDKGHMRIVTGRGEPLIRNDNHGALVGKEVMKQCKNLGRMQTLVHVLFSSMGNITGCRCHLKATNIERELRDHVQRTVYYAKYYSNRCAVEVRWSGAL